MKKTLITILMFGLTLTLFGCGGENGSNKPPTQTPVELRTYAVKTAETVAPKDTTTPPEEGGYGFAEIAESLGYVTHVPSAEELKFFGDSRAKKRGMLTSVVSRYPATMRTEGQHASQVEINTFASLLYEGLLTMHPVTLEYMPALATHWKISEDKMQFWFRINPDARWSDGEEVTADDVIATYDLHMDETILQPSDQLVYGKYERPEALGKYLVTVKCKDLNWRNLLYFGVSMNIFPEHHIGNLSGTEYLEKYHNTVLPGTGAYTILDEDIKSQVSYALTRRLDYWAADHPTNKYTGNFDKIKFVVVRDNTSLEFEKFKKGEQDFYTVAQARRWVEDCDFEAIQKGWVQKRKIFSEIPAGTSGYFFNMREWPFNDKRIRYAFNYLFNRAKMNEEMYYNEYLLQNSLYAGSVYENPTNEQIEYNPEKAMELLAEAGYTERNPEGWLINSNGQVLRVEIGIPKSIDYMVTPYQQMLKDYGIDLQIKFVDSNALWKMMMDRTFQISYMSWGGLVFPNPETSFLSDLADKKDNNNVCGFKNERVDELCEMYDTEFDVQKRIEIIREIDGIVMEELPFALSNYRPYQRLIYWDKFSYPEYMVARYGGDYRSIFTYWWFDEEKINRLNEAMANNETLAQGEMNIMFWPNYLKAQEGRLSEAN